MTPSFAAQAKEEICANPLAQSLPEAELAAMTLSGAAVSGPADACILKYRTESAVVAKRLKTLILDLTQEEPELSAGKRSWLVTVSNGPALLARLGLDAALAGSLPPRALKTRRGRVAAVRGAFLVSGSVSDPNKGYHLEFVTPKETFASLLQSTLRTLGLEAKIFQRKSCFVIYLNEGDSIASLLALIGAHTSILDLENVRVLKETRNNVNRIVNCETANINKSVNAAVAQIRSIELIDREVGLTKLSAALQEAARLRLEYPEATLQELCELSGTTKSGMNHRLRKIKAIARDISGEEL